MTDDKQNLTQAEMLDLCAAHPTAASGLPLAATTQPRMSEQADERALFESEYAVAQKRAGATDEYVFLSLQRNARDEYTTTNVQSRLEGWRAGRAAITQQLASQRVLFEAYAGTEACPLGRDGDEYKNARTQTFWRVWQAAASAAITQQAAPEAPTPMILHCPKCHEQHIDAPDERTEGWVNPPHRSHLCHGCGNIWRPADVPTEGVAAIKTRGANDSAPEAPATQQLDDSWKVVIGAAAALVHLHIENDDEREAMMAHVRRIVTAIPKAHVMPPMRGTGSQHDADRAIVRYENRMIAPNGHAGKWVGCDQEFYEKFTAHPDIGDGFSYETRALCVATPVPRVGGNTSTDQSERNLEMVATPAATTASASGEKCPACKGAGHFVRVRGKFEDTCPDCNGTGRAPAPSREAAPLEATAQNAELVLRRLEALHQESIPGSWRELIEEAMPCALAVWRAATAQQGTADRDKDGAQ